MNRSRGVRFELEQKFLNRLQFYIYEDVMPILKNFAKIRAATNNPSFFNTRILQMEKALGRKLQELSLEHFRDILKLSLVEKFGSWHKVPPQEVTKMLNLLWKQSNFGEKANYFSRRIFQDVKPLFYQTVEEFLEGTDNIVLAVQQHFVTNMSKMANSIYTHSTYFINSAYEIQYRQRDPLENFRYIWQTRPDHRRTPQCEMINDIVKSEASENNEKGVTLDRIKEIVDEVANLPGFIKANPKINLVPHYNCRSSLLRIL